MITKKWWRWGVIMTIGVTVALSMIVGITRSSAAATRSPAHVVPATGLLSGAKPTPTPTPTPLATGNNRFFSTILNDGGVSSYPCVDDYNWNYPLIPFYKVGNGCTVRVWLHQYVNWKDGGWSWCVSPGRDTDVPVEYEYPLNIYISANSAACP